MDFIPLSEIERPAEISGQGYPSPGGGGNHDFLLVVNSRLITPPTGGGGGGDDDGGDGPDIDLKSVMGRSDIKPVFVWIVHGYRITGETLTIRGRKYQNIDPAPGQFGYIAEHDDPTHALTSEFAGAGIRRDGNVYRLRVPHDGTVTIQTRVEAAEPRPPHKGGGCLAAIIQYIRRLLGK